MLNRKFHDMVIKSIYVIDSMYDILNIPLALFFFINHYDFFYMFFSVNLMM